VPLIVEALGGVARRATRCLKFCARRAKDKKRGRDGTKYSRFHPSNYLSHHLANIVTAAVYHDALHIEEGVYVDVFSISPYIGVFFPLSRYF